MLDSELALQELMLASVPNPVVDRLTIRMRDGIQSLQIFDANGRNMEFRILSRTLTTYVVDVSHLTTGVYLPRWLADKEMLWLNDLT